MKGMAQHRPSWMHPLRCRARAIREWGNHDGLCRACVARSRMSLARLTAEQLAGRVLYKDALMLVVDKPAGFPVHAGPGGGPNLERLFGALRFGLPRLP